jgi:hypothetical protein
VKRFAKIILGSLAVLASLLVLALVGINLYLQSGDVQQRIRLATEQALGTPVAVKRTLYTPWGGLALSGLSLPDPTMAGRNLMEAPEFSVQFEFLPLLERRFVISQISLSAPHLVLRQTDDKRWVLLPPRPVPKPPETKPASPVAEGHRISPPAYAVELRTFQIHDGCADIIDRKGQFLLRLSGLSVNGNVGADHTISGDVWIDQMEVGGELYPNRLRADFEQEGDQLAVRNIKCALAGGKVRGELYVVAPKGRQPQFQLRGEVEEVSLPRLIAEAHGDDSGAAGTLAGHFDLKGNPLHASSLAGQGEFALADAQLRPLDFIQQIGALLRIDELQLLDLRQASLAFAVRDERFWVNDLTLKTENLILTGKGPIRFDGKMSLAGRFLVNEKLQRQLGGLIGDQFTPSENANYKQVAFSVTGRLDRPKTDLIEKVTGIELRNMGGILKGLFRMPHPPREQDTPQPPEKAPASS